LTTTGTASASYTSSSAGSQSNGSSPSGWGGGQGSQQLITTRGGECHCSYYVSASASAELHLYSGQDCAALANALADAYIGGLGGHIEASAQVSGSGTGGENPDDGDFPDPDYNQDNVVWYAYNGPDAYHESVAATTVASGGGDTAYASASATASVSMSEL